MVLQSQEITKSLYNVILYHVILQLIASVDIFSIHAYTPTSSFVSPALELLTCQDRVLHWLCTVSKQNSLWLFLENSWLRGQHWKEHYTKKSGELGLSYQDTINHLCDLGQIPLFVEPVFSSVKLGWSPLLCLSSRTITRILQHLTLVPLMAFVAYVTLCFSSFTYLCPPLAEQFPEGKTHSPFPQNVQKAMHMVGSQWYLLRKWAHEWMR